MEQTYFFKDESWHIITLKTWFLWENTSPKNLFWNISSPKKKKFILENYISKTVEWPNQLDYNISEDARGLVS